MKPWIRFIHGIILMCYSITTSASCISSSYSSTPDDRYEILSAGTEVLDKKTKLIWQRCSIGQSWDGATCVGKAAVYSWKDALIAAKQVDIGYRLPNIKELWSLIASECMPAINTTIFPTSDINIFYWSSTPNGFSYALTIRASSGGYGFEEPFYEKSSLHSVRAVRSSQ